MFRRSTLFSAMTGAMIALPSVPAAAQSETENRRIVSAAFDRWKAGGSSFFDDVLSHDVVWTIEGSGPSARTYHGRAAFLAGAVTPFASRLSAPLRPEHVRISADGDQVIVRWTGRTTARDGQPYQNDYAWFLRMRAGRAIEVTAFLDLPAYDDVLRRIPDQVRR